jgi:hypothetical protein
VSVLDGKLERHNRSDHIALRVHYSDCGIPIQTITSLWPALIVSLDIVEDEVFVNPSIVKIVNLFRIEG